MAADTSAAPKKSSLHNEKAKADFVASLAKDKASGPIKSKHIKVIEETAEELAALPVWRRTGSVKSAHTIMSNGAGILPKSPMPDAAVPRVKGYEKAFAHLARLHGKRSAAWTAGFLRDVDFWHHHSTDGRKNPETGRWDRWWVQPLEAFLTQGPHKVSERTFRRICEILVAHVVIEAEVHSKLVEGEPVNCLWIKPTDLFEAWLFDEGEFEELTLDPEKKLPSHKKQEKKKPRGLSALIAERDAGLKYELAHYPHNPYSPYARPAVELMDLYDRCDEEVVLGGDGKRTYRVRPYFSKRGASVRLHLFEAIVGRLCAEGTVPDHLDWLATRKPPKHDGFVLGPNGQKIEF